MCERESGLVVRRADVAEPPKWWPADWEAIIVVDVDEIYSRRTVVDDRPFEGGGLIDKDERVQDERLIRKINGFVRACCRYRISAPPVSASAAPAP